MSSVRDERKNGQVSGALDGFRQLPLMRRADSADPPGQNFPPLRNKMTEELSVFEIDVSDFFRAEFADSFAPNTESSWTWHNKWPFYRKGPGILNPVPGKPFTDLIPLGEPVRILPRRKTRSPA